MAIRHPSHWRSAENNPGRRGGSGRRKVRPTQAAYNVVPNRVRNSRPNSRVTLGIDINYKAREGATTTFRIGKRVLNGRVRVQSSA